MYISWLRTVREHTGLIFVLGIALAERLAFLRWWKAFPGGDTYNFILIAQELLRGSYPVAEKRLPVYPALLALFHAVFDWETAGVVVAILSSLAAIALLYAFGRKLGLSKTALVIALLPFQAVAPFLFQSIRGYADTTFLALLLGGMVTLLHVRSVFGSALAGALLGLASLTRFEGVLVVPVLALIALLRSGWKRAIVLALGVALVWLPFVLQSLWVGRPLLPQEYITDAEQTAFGVGSVREFTTNVGTVWRGVGLDRVWGEPKRIVRELGSPALSHLRSFFVDPKRLPSLLLLAGLAGALRWRRRTLVFVFLVFAALTVPVAWWGVRQRFLLPLYPFVFLGVAAGVDVLRTGLHRLAARWPRVSFLPLVVSAVLVALAVGPWRAHTAAEAREVQAKNYGKDYAYYQAIQFARTLPGRIAFDHRSSIALALFGEPDHGRAVFADTHLDAREPSAQWEQLQQWNVRAIVVLGDGERNFPALDHDAFPRTFTLLREFTFQAVRGGTNVARVYAR